VNPARSATRWDAAFSGAVIRFSRLMPSSKAQPETSRTAIVAARRRIMPAAASGGSGKATRRVSRIVADRPDHRSWHQGLVGLSALRDDPDTLGVVRAEVQDGLVFRRFVPGLGRSLRGKPQHDGDLAG